MPAFAYYRRMNRIGLGFRLAAGLALAVAAAAASGAGTASSPAIAALAGQFDRHAVVMLGELHRSREIHAFLQQLLRDPAFICRVDDVVVEFGNARLQPVADAYVAGGKVGETRLQSLWRETAVPLTWNSPLYREVFVTLREINAKRLCPRPLRLLLGDPPLDWSRIATAADYARFTDRDGHLAAVIEREVLDKQRRALVISGKLHAMKQLPPGAQDDPRERLAAQIIESRHPGALFSVVSVDSAAAVAALQLAPAPSFVVLRGNALAQADFALTDPDWKAPLAGADVATRGPEPALGAGLRMGEVVDGLLNLGGFHPVYPSPTIYLDPAYQQELRRRAAIIEAHSGQDFLPAIDALVEAARRMAPSAPR